MSRTYYRHNGYNVVCDSCGFWFKQNELRLRWDGFMVCKPCWTPRQPQDLLKARTEDMRLPYTRPVGSDYFIPSNFTASPRDYLLVTETAFNRTVTFVRNLFDGVSFPDQIAGTTNPGFADTVSTGESLSRTLVYNRGISDTVTFTDNPQVIFHIPQELNGDVLNGQTLG